MPDTRSYESPRTTPTDRTDGAEAQAPAPNAYTDTPPGQVMPRDGMNGWGTGARWLVLALLAIAFVVCLYVLR
jgi:hypothetical protein